MITSKTHLPSDIPFAPWRSTTNEAKPNFSDRKQSQKKICQLLCTIWLVSHMSHNHVASTWKVYCFFRSIWFFNSGLLRNLQNLSDDLTVTFLDVCSSNSACWDHDSVFPLLLENVTQTLDAKKLYVMFFWPEMSWQIITNLSTHPLSWGDEVSVE